MSNPSLSTLLEACREQLDSNITRDELVHLLQPFSFHWSLEAICLVLNGLFALEDDYPGTITNHPIEQWDKNLDLLRAIGRLEGLPDKYYKSEKSKTSDLPLWPHSGDCPIAEAILNRLDPTGLDPEEFEELDAKFDEAISWLIWQFIRFHSIRLYRRGYLK